MSARAESEFRYKLVCEQKNEMAEIKREKDRLEKERDGLEGKRKNLEEGNKVLAVARNQLEGMVREKTSELAEKKALIA